MTRVSERSHSFTRHAHFLITNKSESQKCWYFSADEYHCSLFPVTL